jgi:hypothetical protein
MTAFSPIAASDDADEILQRAVAGTCWTLGIAARARKSDSLHVHAVRRLALRAVLDAAAGGARHAHELKLHALRRLHPILGGGFSRAV